MSSQTTIANLMKTTERSQNEYKTEEKGEIALYEQFLLFPKCCQKTYYRLVKTRVCFGKG